MFSPERLASLRDFVNERVPTAERIVEMRGPPDATEEELAAEMMKLVVEIEGFAKELGKKRANGSRFTVGDVGVNYPNLRLYWNELTDLLAERGLNMSFGAKKFCDAYLEFSYAALEVTVE